MQKVRNISGRCKDYVSFFLKTRFKFNIHSPFVYDFVDQVLEDDTEYPEFKIAESVRNKYKDSKEKIKKIDYGSIDSKTQKPKSRNTTVGKIMKNSSILPKEGELLFKMVRYYKPRYILEIGTSLGISTIYQGLGAKDNDLSMFHTIEGCPNVSQKAKDFNHELSENEPSLRNINYHTGPFEEKLPEVLEKFPQLDLVFFDGNHNRDASLKYFNWCLKKAHDNSIFIFDDIYHSRKMKRAWETVKINQKVRTTIDLFSLGIVFFNNPYAKQNFTIGF